MLVLREEGQGLVEYALIIMLIALLIIAGLALVGNALSSIYNSVGSAFGT